MSIDYTKYIKGKTLSRGVGKNASRTKTGTDSRKKNTTVNDVAPAASLKARLGSGTSGNSGNAIAPPSGRLATGDPYDDNERNIGVGTGGYTQADATAAALGTGQNIMDQNFTGWAAGIRPNAVPMMFQEPQAFLRQVMGQMGMSANTNPGMYYMALPNADFANALAMLQLGGSSDFSQGNTNQVLNTMGDFFSQGLTRGGQGVDFRGGLSNALGSGTGTPLGDFLNLDDPRGQVQAMSSLLMPLAEAGLHPLFAQAFQAELSRLADEYYSRSAFGTPDASFQAMLNKRLGNSF